MADQAATGSIQGSVQANGLGVPPPEPGAVGVAAPQAAAVLRPLGVNIAVDSSAALLFPGLAAAHLAAPIPQALVQVASGTTNEGSARQTGGTGHSGPEAARVGPSGVVGHTEQTAVVKREPGVGPREQGHGPGAGAGPPTDARGPSEPSTPEAVAATLASRVAAAGASVIFEKALTASDVSGGGRVVVPKSIAEQYFPKLEQPSGVTISATDLDGRTYTFKWRFWVNNSSRMYLLEGAGELHRNYGLEVGDVMVFAQKPDGSLVVAGRVASKADVIKKPPIKRPAPGNSHAGGWAGARREPRPQRPPAARQTPALAGPDGGNLAGAGCIPGYGSALGEGVPARGRKRKAVAPGPGGPDPRVRLPTAPEPMSLAVLDMEAPSDGVFRAVPTQHLQAVPIGLALARNNRWTATLDVAGELYQAFFDTKDDALEALAAAGASP